MSGIDNIIKEIDACTNTACENILSDANNTAQNILQSAKEKSDKIFNEETEKIETKVKTYTEAEISKANSQSARNLLNAKINAVNTVIDEAVNSLINLDTEEYFGILLKIFNLYKPTEKCTLHLNDKDYRRCPDSFKTAVSDYAEISEKTYCISGGFVLDYGDTKENCSFEAICSAKKEQIKDTVANILFA